MKARKWLWLGMAAVEGGLLFAWHQWLARTWAASLSGLQWSYGIGYVLFAVLLLGALARLRVTAHPAIWRMLVLIAGSAVSWVEIGLHGYPKGYILALWPAAIIGLAAVSIAARFLPQQVLNFWLGKAEEK